MNLIELQPTGKMRRLQRLVLGILPLTLLGAGTAFGQVANDECDTAAILDPAAPFPPFTDSVDATDATLNDSDPLLTCNAAGDNDGTQTVWWSYTPNVGGLVNISTTGSTEAGGGELDTAHGAFVGACGALVQVACVDQGLTDDLNFEVEAGTTYYIKVGQFAGGSDAGTVQVNVEEGVEPILPQRIVMESAENGTSPPIRDIVGAPAATLAAAQGGNALDALREMPNQMLPGSMATKSGTDNVGSQVSGTGRVKWNGPATLLNVFDGGNNDDNWNVLGTFIAPPDTIGEVGPNHYVQMFNLLTEIFDKQGNSLLGGPFPTSTFFTGMSGNCAISDDGDPIILFDEETNRWMVSQFLASFQDGLCIAISETDDPTGVWHQYEYDFTGIGFPDYPKFGFSTGALNVMVNLFTPFQGSALGAIDKSEMLNGEPATMVLFTGGEAAQLAFGWVPGDNDGPVFDNTRPTFFTNLGFSGDTLFVGEIFVDWAAPEQAGLGFTAIPVAPWDSSLCNGPRGACIPQPGSGTTDGADPVPPPFTQVITFLEGITDRMMHRGQTRDDGDRKTAILNHTVDVDGTGRAGIRWYELRNHKDRGWTLFKQNTFSPDGENRWMGSIAMTASGSTCLGYSISSFDTYPSIGITGRKGRSNHMNIRELVAYDGNATANVQRLTARWGDYSGMSIDPVDDTCWFTTEHARYAESIWPSQQVPFGEVFGWGTKVIHYDVK